MPSTSREWKSPHKLIDRLNLKTPVNELNFLVRVSSVIVLRRLIIFGNVKIDMKLENRNESKKNNINYGS